jgi:hypothetical protein
VPDIVDVMSVHVAVVDARSVGQLAPGQVNVKISGGDAPGPGVRILASAIPRNVMVERRAIKITL